MRWTWACMALVWGCRGETSGGDVPALDEGIAADMAADMAADAGPDAGLPAREPLAGAECAPGALRLGDGEAQGDCVQSARIDQDGLRYQKGMVRADCTDPAIQGLLEKRHMVLVPAQVTQDALWVHFGGSGGQPSNSENIGRAAVAAGYRYVSLAYPNEPSVSERCTCDGLGPRDPTCEGWVRHEVLYGDDVTPWFDMTPAEAIQPRLVALLRYLDTQQPDGGWATYLDGDAPAWTRIAVSGFSQGGGMAGLVARDHAVVRALYLSKGAGATAAALLDGAAVQACDSDGACAPGVPCCPLSDPECAAPGPDAYCLAQVPVPWAMAGRDVDGDGAGDGDVSTRATPPERQFAVIHRDEGAWAYSPEVFAAWGLGPREGIVDADALAPPFGDAQVFSTGLTPRNSCSTHQSMGADACQALGADGRPAMWPVWTHAMTAPVGP